MPKRTNPFQQLVHLIQSLLAGNATVEESAMLPDLRTNTPVEVDIVLKSNVAETPVTIGIECRDHKRPATVEWVREMSAKHQDLAVDKTVLVSRAGFSAEARRKAATLGIDVLSLSEAEDADWNAFIQSLSQLRFAGFRLSLVETTLKLKHPESLPDKHLLQPESMISEPDAPDHGTVNDYANGFIHHQKIATQIMSAWYKSEARERKYGLTITWTPPANTTVRDNDGNEHEIAAIVCKVKVSVVDTPFTLTPRRYRDVNIAVGEVEDIFGTQGGKKYQFVAREESGDLGPGAFRIPATGEVRDMIRYEGNEGESEST